MENKLQSDCFIWFWNNYVNFRYLMYHIPNGGNRSAREGNMFKAMGVIAGIPDLCLALPKNEYGALYIEIKFGKGKQSQKQIDVANALKNAGNKVVVIYSLEEFKKEITEYISLI
jgi:hypothetical protein